MPVLRVGFWHKERASVAKDATSCRVGFSGEDALTSCGLLPRGVLPSGVLPRSPSVDQIEWHIALAVEDVVDGAG